MNITSIAIIWFAGIRIGAGKMEIGDMMAFLQYAMMIMFSLIMVSIMYVMVPRAQAVSADRIEEVLKMHPEITDPENPKSFGTQKGHVEFRDVTFHYQGAEKPALAHLNFTSEPGEVTAVIGGTGSGKTTLISLIMRFYDIDEVDEGSIMVDGTDIRDITQKDLRAKIGFVPQSTVLFNGSISHNIRYGKQDAPTRKYAMLRKSLKPSNLSIIWKMALMPRLPRAAPIYRADRSRGSPLPGL